MLLLVCAGALVLAWLRAREASDYPLASTRSTAPDGAAALFLWAEALGRRPQRIARLADLPAAAPDTVLVLQPLVPIDAESRRSLDAVAARGGTLIVAGDSPAVRAYWETLGVDAVETPRRREATRPGEDETVVMTSRLRLESEGLESQELESQGQGTTPLLVAPDGDVLALRKTYLGGSMVAVASAAPFTNDGLRDTDTARFVRDIVFRSSPESDEPGGTIAFDETHYVLQNSGGQTVQTFGGLLRQTATGRAVLYAGLVTFAFLLLAGRRLGPPLAPAAPTAPSRTMAEQVQALAGLYRRAGQLGSLRAHFTAWARRGLAQGAGQGSGVAAGMEDVGDGEVAARLVARGVAPW
ncbi:MAG: DUF4350 domain-containing protein, partial [Chloroflexota bacterium]|nr:DUF4350 domain-containing protein [Chloroflexota bacterium]